MFGGGPGPWRGPPRGGGPWRGAPRFPPSRGHDSRGSFHRGFRGHSGGFRGGRGAQTHSDFLPMRENFRGQQEGELFEVRCHPCRETFFDDEAHRHHLMSDAHLAATAPRVQPQPPMNASRYDEDEPVFDENYVLLDWYNSDLNLSINKSDLCSAQAWSHNGFAYLWAGVRATYGATRGRVCYEVLITGNENAEHSREDESEPYVLRCGWSVDSSSLALGTEPLSYGFGGTGKISTNNNYLNYGRRFGVNDVIGCFLDMTCEPAIIGYSLNGIDLGPAFRVSRSELAGQALYPHILTKNQNFLVNFGQLPGPLCQVPPHFAAIGQLDIADGLVRATKAPARREDCEVLQMIGLPGAGKSYWANEQKKRHLEKKYNIMGTNSLIDRMKVMGLARQRNYQERWDHLIAQCTECFSELIKVASKRRRNYILDQTNVYPTARARKMKDFLGFQCKSIVVVPDDLEFKNRCQIRALEEGKEVPTEALLEMKANFVLPDVEETYAEVFYVELGPRESHKLVQEYNREALVAGCEMTKNVKDFIKRNAIIRAERNLMEPMGAIWPDNLKVLNREPEPSRNMLREKQGTRWHSSDIEAKERGRSRSPNRISMSPVRQSPPWPKPSSSGTRDPDQASKDPTFDQVPILSGIQGASSEQSIWNKDLEAQSRSNEKPSPWGDQDRSWAHQSTSNFGGDRGRGSRRGYPLNQDRRHNQERGRPDGEHGMLSQDRRNPVDEQRMLSQDTSHPGDDLRMLSQDRSYPGGDHRMLNQDRSHPSGGQRDWNQDTSHPSSGQRNWNQDRGHPGEDQRMLIQHRSHPGGGQRSWNQDRSHPGEDQRSWNQDRSHPSEDQRIWNQGEDQEQSVSQERGPTVDALRSRNQERDQPGRDQRRGLTEERGYHGGGQRRWNQDSGDHGWRAYSGGRLDNKEQNWNQRSDQGENWNQREYTEPQQTQDRFQGPHRGRGGNFGPNSNQGRGRGFDRRIIGNRPDRFNDEDQGPFNHDRSGHEVPSYNQFQQGQGGFGRGRGHPREFRRPELRPEQTEAFEPQGESKRAQTGPTVATQLNERPSRMYGESSFNSSSSFDNQKDDNERRPKSQEATGSSREDVSMYQRRDQIDSQRNARPSENDSYLPSAFRNDKFEPGQSSSKPRQLPLPVSANKDLQNSTTLKEPSKLQGPRAFDLIRSGVPDPQAPPKRPYEALVQSLTMSQKSIQSSGPMGTSLKQMQLPSSTSTSSKDEHHHHYSQYPAPRGYNENQQQQHHHERQPEPQTPMSPPNSSGPFGSSLIPKPSASGSSGSSAPDYAALLNYLKRYHQQMGGNK